MFFVLLSVQSGNFQFSNLGKGGSEGDPVVAHCLSAAGVNNADFTTYVDGIPPRLRMYIFDRTTPHRDASFESLVIIHEFGHGVMQRLSCGPNVVVYESVSDFAGNFHLWCHSPTPDAFSSPDFIMAMSI